LFRNRQMEHQQLVVVCTALLLCCASLAVASPGCISDSGKPVDWWVVIKIPTIGGNKDPSADGYGYLYADSTSTNLQISSKQLDVDGTSTAPGATLNQIYTANTGTTGWLMYDDETPNGNSYSSYGHTKGDVCFDTKQGFWLVHSVPRWPPVPPSPYEFPSDEKTYGQSMLCQTYATSQFNLIGANFILNKPYVYSWSMTAALNSTLPNMVSVIQKDFSYSKPATAIQNLKTVGGASFTAFGKNSGWNQSLYEDLVSPHYNLGFYWETWQNGATSDVMPSFCTPQYKYDSINISNITVSSSIAWKETNDHSKWGVDMSGKNTICIGDINRQWSQNQRGGGTVCQVNSGIYKSFRNMITGFQGC